MHKGKLENMNTFSVLKHEYEYFVCIGNSWCMYGIIFRHPFNNFPLSPQEWGSVMFTGWEPVL